MLQWTTTQEQMPLQHGHGAGMTHSLEGDAVERRGEVLYRGGRGYAGDHSESGGGQAPVRDRGEDHGERRGPGGGHQPERVL